MRLTSKIYAKEILKDITNKRIILYERDKNIEFVKKYNITNRDIENIIYSLTEYHFKAKIDNKDKNIKADYLYYFKAILSLTDEYGNTLEYVYIKICEIKKGILVVSLHPDE